MKCYFDNNLIKMLGDMIIFMVKTDNDSKKIQIPFDMVHQKYFQHSISLGSKFPNKRPHNQPPHLILILAIKTEMMI